MPDFQNHDDRSIGLGDGAEHNEGEACFIRCPVCGLDIASDSVECPHCACNIAAAGDAVQQPDHSLELNSGNAEFNRPKPADEAFASQRIQRRLDQEASLREFERKKERTSTIKLAAAFVVTCVAGFFAYKWATQEPPAPPPSAVAPPTAAPAIPLPDNSGQKAAWAKYRAELEALQAAANKAEHKYKSLMPVYKSAEAKLNTAGKGLAIARQNLTAAQAARLDPENRRMAIVLENKVVAAEQDLARAQTHYNEEKQNYDEKSAIYKAATAESESLTAQILRLPAPPKE